LQCPNAFETSTNRSGIEFPACLVLRNISQLHLSSENDDFQFSINFGSKKLQVINSLLERLSKVLKERDSSKMDEKLKIIVLRAQMELGNVPQH